MDTTQRTVLGIDAGGTRIRAVLATEAGTVLGQGLGAAGNALSVPPAELAERLLTALRAAVPAAAVGSVCAVLAGFAGVSWLDDDDDRGRTVARAAVADAARELGLPVGIPVAIRSDVEVAFAAGPQRGGDGLLLIGGTGAVAARLAGNRVVVTADGHGAMLDDAGGGHWIGRQAARRALRALDGRGPWTALVPAITGRLLDAPVTDPPADPADRERIRWLLVPSLIGAGLPALAELCPLVPAAARDGDAVASAILAEAVDNLVDTLRALHPTPGEPLVTTGGLLGPGGPLLDALAARLAADGLIPVPVSDGTVGATNLAWRLAGAADHMLS